MPDDIVHPAGLGSDSLHRGNALADPLTDDEMWRILGWRPTSPQERGRILFPCSAGMPVGLSADSDNSPSAAWIAWAKGEIQRVDKDLLLYLCRLMRLLEIFHQNEIRHTPAVERGFLAAAYASGLAIAGRDFGQDFNCLWESIFAEAESCRVVLSERVDAWRPGLASGSGWKCYVRLTVAGRRWLESQDATSLPSWIAPPSESQRDEEVPEEDTDIRSSSPAIDSSVPLEGDGLEGRNPETRPSAIVFFRNEARDRWIYEECCGGTPYKNIVFALCDRAVSDGWEPIETEQGILRAARNYAERKRLPELPVRKRGRPRQAEN